MDGTIPCPELKTVLEGARMLCEVVGAPTPTDTALFLFSKQHTHRLSPTLWVTKLNGAFVAINGAFVAINSYR